MNNKRAVKLLAAAMVMAVALAGVVVVFSDDAQAGPETPTTGTAVIDLSTETPGTGDKWSIVKSGDPAVLTLNGYDGNKGFYYNGNLTIKVSGTNTITVDRAATPELAGLGVAAIYTIGTLTIESDDADGADALNIIVKGNYTGNNQAEGTYGIYSKGAVDVSNIALKMSVSEEDPCALAVRTLNGKATFSGVTGSIQGGNRGINTTAAAVAFDGSNMTIIGGEKAVQANVNLATVTLENASKITMKLVDPLYNAGDNDRFALKINNALKVSADSTLNVQGLRLMSSANVDDMAGKVIVSGGYEQNENAKIPVKIAGLYSEMSTVAVKKISSASAAVAGNISILDDAEIYGKAVTGDAGQKSESTSAAVVENLADTTIQTVTYTGNEALTVTVPEKKTLVLTDASLNASTITLSEGSVISVGATLNNPLTVKNGDNTAVFTNLPANVQIMKGSIIVVGPLSGDFAVTGDVKLQGSVANNLNITSSAGANVVLVDGFSVASTKTLSFDGVTVSSQSAVQNAGTIDFKTGTKVNGTFTVLGGTVFGKVTSGSVILATGQDVSGSSFTIGEDARLTVSSGVELSDVTNNGTITLYGILATGENNGTINVAEGGVVTSISGSGTINYAKSSDATISGELDTDTKFGKNQNVTVTGNLTLVEGTKLTIEGKLIIPDGVTVTIEKGSRLIADGQAASIQNAGKIVVQSKTGDEGLSLKNGAKFVNDGIVTASYALTSEVDTVSTVISIGANSEFQNNGLLTIGDESRITIAGSLVNTASAEIDIYGELSGNIKNSGYVVIDGTIVTGAIINLVASGAAVDVVSVQGANLTINDTGLKSGTVSASNVDSVVIAPDANYAVEGLTVSVSASVSDGELSKTFAIAGKMSYSYKGSVSPAPTVAAPVATVTLSGTDLTVSETAEFVEYITLVNSGTLKVSGTLTAYTLTNTSGTITVSGLVETVKAKINAGTVNAAMYSVKVLSVETYYYTTLAEAIEADAKSIEVTGSITVGTEVDIPSGTTVSLAASSKLTVSKDGFVTVEDGARISGSGDIDVKGNLYYEVAKTGKKSSGAVDSEVYSTDGTDALYTNLVSAMAAADSGETITLNGPATLQLTSFAIKDGVTLKTDGKKLTVDGSTLTIDGVLYLTNASDLDVKEYTYGSTGLKVPGTVVLNGMIQSPASLSSLALAGAYYAVLDDGVQINCITTVAQAAEDITSAVGKKVTLEGELTAGEVAFAGTSADPVTVIVNGKLTATKVALKDAIMTVDGKTFVGTVAGTNGSVALSNAAYSGVKFTAATAGGAEMLTVSGQVSDAANKMASFVVEGTVYADGLTVSYMTINGTLEVAGTMIVNNTITVMGTLNVNAGNSLAATGAKSMVVVKGAFNVATATTTTAAGAATVSKLYVGLTSGDLAKSTAASASVSGNVVLTATSEASPVKPVAYVIAGATVPESITAAESVKKTEFYVEDKLWMTAYGVDGSTFNVSKAPVTDADFTGWKTASGTKYTGDSASSTKYTAIPAGTADLTAMVTYDVYTVTVYSDGGFASVALDGVLMYQETTNKFVTVSKIAAGTHKITATLKSGYEGTAVFTIDGTAISDGSFTVSGDNRAISINLTGATASSPVTPTPAKGDSSITDILLIVLVVLIAIMAIMVALRMMRS